MFQIFAQVCQSLLWLWTCLWTRTWLRHCWTHCTYTQKTQNVCRFILGSSLLFILRMEGTKQIVRFDMAQCRLLMQLLAPVFHFQWGLPLVLQRGDCFCAMCSISSSIRAMWSVSSSVCVMWSVSSSVCVGVVSIIIKMCYVVNIIHHYVLRANVVDINISISLRVTWSVSLPICSSLDYLNIALPLCDYLSCINHISVGRKIWNKNDC